MREMRAEGYGVGLDRINLQFRIGRRRSSQSRSQKPPAGECHRPSSILWRCGLPLRCCRCSRRPPASKPTLRAAGAIREAAVLYGRRCGVAAARMRARPVSARFWNESIAARESHLYMRRIFTTAAALSACLLAATSPRFDIASLSRSRSSGTAYSGHVRRYPGEPVTLTLQNVTLQFCIQQAFSAKAYQVTGPGWIKSTRYDLTATLPPGADVNQIWPALQTLLAERLKLSVRHDKREMLLYAMTLAPGGSKIRARTDAGPKALRFQAGAPQDMGDRSGGHASGTMRMNNSSLENFCDRLSRRANHPVV